MRRVLIPFDGSESSMRALNYLVDFAKHYGKPEVHVLNVQEAPMVYGDYVTPMMVDTLAKASLKAGADVVARASAVLDEAGIAHQVHVEEGAIADTVAAYVEKLGCDAVVMGTRGMGAFGSLLLGSTAQKVLHAVHVPVTLVR